MNHLIYQPLFLCFTKVIFFILYQYEHILTLFLAVTNNDSTISIDDLNVFQAQLEILATDAAKRKCILRNKIKAIPPEQLEESEELLKQLKITNYEKYQQQLQSEQGFDAASGTDNNVSEF